MTNDSLHNLKLRALAYRFFVAIVISLCASLSAYPQGASSISGNWVWKGPARRNKPQVKFRLSIHRKGDAVSGVYSVDEFINGKWQGEDGNQTPFRGRVKGDTIQIEFDPQATVPGYQEDVAYSDPSDGRKPGTASLTLSGQTLIWRLSGRPGIEGVPAQVALRRERRK